MSTEEYYYTTKDGQVSAIVTIQAADDEQLKAVHQELQSLGELPTIDEAWDKAEGVPKGLEFSFGAEGGGDEDDDDDE